jgi:3-oxoacyl-[acyl-carrier protein] reductase
MNSVENMFSLRDRVVVVTGACGQLGQAFSKSLKLAGAHVIGLDKEAGGDVPFLDELIVADVASEKDIFTAFEQIQKKYHAIHGLVNNAGVAVFTPFEKRTDKEIDFVVDVNVRGVIHCTRAFVEQHAKIADSAKQKGNGYSIVNIASFYGVISPDFRIYTDCARRSSEVYGATKAAVIHMTKYFAVHLSPRSIRVNAISPGGILNESDPQGADFQRNYSERCPMGRMGLASEMSGAALYFLSDVSSYTTGSNLIIDGGMNCW